MARFCGLCGAPLDPVTGLCPNCNAGQVHMAPVNEGNQAAADVQETVASATSGEATAPDMARQRKSAGRVVAVVGGLVLLVALVAGLLVIGDRTGMLALTAQGKATRQLSLGQKYLQEEDYEQAVIAFNKAIALDERQIDAYEGLIDAYLALGDIDAAYDCYLTAQSMVDTDSGEDVWTVYGDRIDAAREPGMDAEEEVPATEEAMVTEEKMLVTDAETDAYTVQIYQAQIGAYAADESLLTYHIPQINLSYDQVADMNQEIRDWAEEIIQEYRGSDGQILSPEDDYILRSVDYQWNAVGDMLSVLVWAYADIPGTDETNTHYVAYNVNIETGERLSDREVLQIYGMTEDQFDQLVREDLEAELDSAYESYSDDMPEEVEASRQKALSDENIGQAVLYVNADGRLEYVVATQIDGCLGPEFMVSPIVQTDPLESASDTVTIEMTAADAEEAERNLPTITNKEIRTTVNGTRQSRRVPHINLTDGKADAINAEIEAVSDVEDYYYHQAGNLLSIILERVTDEGYYEDEVFYCVDTDTGEQLSIQDALQHLGLSSEDYEGLVQDTVYVYEANPYVYDTLSDEDVDAARIYINSEGHLGIAVYADSGYVLLDTGVAIGEL